MCDYEILGLILFIAFIAIVYVPGLVVLVRRSLPGTKRSKLGWVERGILAAGFAGLLCMAYGCFVEPYWVEVTRIKISSKKLANFDRPIRVVQISDLHSEENDRVVGALPALIAAQKPDLIVFTGDSVNSAKAVPLFRKCFAQLSSIAPTFAVLGNHDSRCWCNLDLFRNTNVVALNGAARKLKIAGQDIYLAGVAFDSEALTAQALNAVPPGAFTVFLYHSPDLIMELAKRNVDLCCAGHTHGGQVCLPFYGAIITQSKFGKRFESGLHQVGQTALYVNRGIGMEGGIDPRVRFLARPEVTVFELQPADHQRGLALRSGTTAAKLSKKT